MTNLIYRYPTFYGFDYQEAGVMVIRGENIGRDGALTPSDEPCFISDEINVRFPRTVLEEGDLVMSVRGEVGKTALITCEYAGCNINANTIRISLKSKLRGHRICPDFVWAVLNSRLGKAQLRRFIAGGVQETITAPEILEVVVPFINEQDQQNFVNALRQSMKRRDAKVAQADALLNGIDDLILAELGLPKPTADGRLAYAVRLGELKGRCDNNAIRFDPHYNATKFWKLVGALKGIQSQPLGAIAGFSDVQWNPSTHNQDTFRYIEISGVDIFTSELTATETSVNQAPSRARMLVQEGDILISLTRPHRGAIGIVPKDLHGAIASTGFAVIRGIVAKECRPDCLLAILRSSVCLQQMLQRSSGGNYPAITKQELKRITVPLLPEIAQQKIVAEVSKRKEQSRRVRAEAAALWAKALDDFERKLLVEGAKP